MPNRDSAENNELRAALGAGRDCPPIEQLEQWLAKSGTVSPDMSRHIETCAYCKTELALLRDFQSGALRESEAAPVRIITERLRARSSAILPARPEAQLRDSWWRAFWTVRWLTPAALAAAAVLIFIAVDVQWRNSAPALHAPAAPDQEVMRSGAITVVSPRGDVQQTPAQVRWQPIRGAVKYRVRLMEVDHSELWSAETTEEHIDLPGEAREHIVPLKTLLWEVSGLDSSGRVVAESNSIAFRLLQTVYTR
jgi:hypothetical protein